MYQVGKIKNPKGKLTVTKPIICTLCGKEKTVFVRVKRGDEVVDMCISCDQDKDGAWPYTATCSDCKQPILKGHKCR